MKFFDSFLKPGGKHEVPFCVLMLATSLFCALVCFEFLCMVFKYNAVTFSNVAFIVALVVVNAAAAILNLDRLSKAIKVRLR